MIEIPEPSQRVFEGFFRELREQGIKIEDISFAEYAGALARAAVKVGWFAFDTDNAKPKEVMAIRRQIQKFIETVLEDPKN